ncbi:conjugal transfer protein [Salmonella enterica]|uniref:Conjugal transfer protein n=1 Tax=Salmonella enterica TaxID=28901 RepID=A0A5U3BVD0_SALER|nr:conjugal transfer protein [Salmonella enterica]EBI4029686.1 conjugal transfer protein [Salmonella enterica]EBP3427711.1 conjugal transfer protein [Salmonella enterica]EBR3353168.1 conjugal transfer protein [Salmonella enterica]EBR5007406.1 conjugal transfer protein [Salmonella enterica]
MTKRSLYALGFMIPGIFSPLPGVSATTPTVSPLPPPPSMSVYLSPEADDHNGVNDTVYQMLTEAGKTEGFRGGKAQRAWELRQSLEQRARQLDSTYLFSPLINRQGWLPPVIAEATSLATITDKQMRTASHVYNILVPERFVSNPPGWRQYLFAGLSIKSAPTDTVIPRNRAERTVWQNAIRNGWQEGRQSADDTLAANFNRLTRDYTGMMRYSLLVKQKMITPPVIAEQQQSVSGSREELMLGDKVRDLKQRAGFDLDKKKWEPLIQTRATQ